MNVVPTPARLRLDGVESPIVMSLQPGGERGPLVRQTLPFLRRGTMVTSADGLRARIAAVSIAMDGDVPSLQLELEAASSTGASNPAPAARGEFVPGVSQRPARRDETVPYELGTARRRALGPTGAAPRERSAAASADASRGPLSNRARLGSRSAELLRALLSFGQRFLDRAATWLGEPPSPAAR